MIEVTIEFHSYIMKKDHITFHVNSMEQLKATFREWCKSRDMDQNTQFTITNFKG